MGCGGEALGGRGQDFLLQCHGSVRPWGEGREGCIEAREEGLSREEPAPLTAEMRFFFTPSLQSLEPRAHNWITRDPHCMAHPHLGPVHELL